MKRKKWSEVEEQTLLSKYSDLLRSGTLSKLKTREKKFKPVAEHVNAVHHLRDPTTFPFKWSWRDVSIKVQNMRHQYLGVKQKIRVSPHHFNWNDGTIHWENFLAYKDVFGDVHLDPKPNNNKQQQQQHAFTNSHDLGFQFDSSDDDDDNRDDDSDDSEDSDYAIAGSIGVGVLELRDAVVKREERRKEREFRKEKVEMEIEIARREVEFERERLRWEKDLESELVERRLRWEVEKRGRVERELEEERRRRKRVEERMEEEMMEWRERMLMMQVEHEKQMMQMQVDACQNQMQILGIMARLLCQFFGSGNDGGLGGGLGALPLPPQVLQNLHHTAALDNVKPDANSPSEFI